MSIGLAMSPRAKKPRVAARRPPRRSAYAARVRPQREQKEEGREDVLALCHPGHGLHVERVEPEERRHRDASPQSPAHEEQDMAQEHRIEHVEQEGGGMVPSGVEIEELHVDHVGDPGERVPVGGMAMVKAQAMDSPVSPRWTMGLLVT